MKKLLFLFAMLLVMLPAFAQTTLIKDTIQGAETITFDSFRYTGSGDVIYQALMTELGGTSDGTFWLQGSIDGISYVDLTEKSNFIVFFPNDTLDIVDGAVFTVLIKKSAMNYFRAKGTGDTSDTTLVTHKWDYKR